MIRVTARASISHGSSDALANAVVVIPTTSVLDGDGLATVSVVGEGLLLTDSYNEVTVLEEVSTFWAGMRT